MNTLRSFTETVVTTPTDTFPISFEYDEKYDAVHVFLNDVAVGDLGYTVSQVNAVTLKIEPAIPEGTVRIERETDIDKMKYIFDAGALFIDQNVDADFRQIVHSQQEVRDGFIKLRGEVLPLVHGLQEALKQAQEVSEAAQEAAEAAEEAAQVTRIASQVIDESGLSQQQWNNGVESIAELLAIQNPNNGSRVFVKSRTAGTGKGGGYFEFHTGSKKDDGGMFFATATGSWHRVTMEIWHNIEWWGAIGDGVTDDTAAIKRAVLAHKYDALSNKMPRGSFCTIFFPASEGAYIVSDTIYLMPFIRLKGDSAFGGSTTHNHKKYASIIGANFPNSINYAWVISTENYKTNGDALDWNSYYTGVDVDSGNVTPCFGACVEDLWIDNINRFNRIYGGVRFIAAPESTINNCWVTGFDVAVMFTGSWNIRANVSTQAVKCGVALWGDINGCTLNGYQHKITDVSPLPDQVAIFEIPTSTSCGVYAQYAQYSSANLISEYFGYGVYNQSEVKASIQNLYTEANNIGIHVGTLCSAQIDGISGVSNNYAASTASGATLIVKAVKPNNYLESFFSDLNARTRYVELPSTVGKFDTTNPAVNVLGYLEKNIVYVDSTIGSDDNHGLTIDFPVQTLNRAMTIASTMPAPNHHKTAFVNKARKSATIHFLDSGIYRPRTHQDVQNMDIIFTSTYGLTPKIVTGGQCFKLIDSTVLVQSSVLLQREYEDNYQPSQGMFICVGVCSVSTRGNMQLEYPLVSVDPSVVADVNIDILGGTGAMTGTARYFQTTSNNVAVRVFVRLNNTGADINSRSDKGVEVPAQTYVVKNISQVLS
uniref:Tail fiber protein n=1 Tax=Acinetobacter phage vB_Ab_1137_KEN_02 TaxID=3143013 RepID=A0AAU8KV76_9VIRU